MFNRSAWKFATLAVVALAGAVVPVHAAPTDSATSPFALRAVIQGRYGPPWSHAQRADLLPWLAEHDLNAYIHAPKDDLYQRYWWRLPYPEAEFDDFRDEMHTAAALGVTWVPNMQPALPLLRDTPIDAQAPSRDICFSCPTDVDQLIAKYDRFFDAGARTLMLSFDDAVKVSTHPQDAIAYGVDDAAFGRMNRDLLNRVYRHFRARAGTGRFTLLTVLADYSGTADTEYLAGVRSGGGLDEGIDVFWTGGATLAATVHPADARAYAALVGRTKVLLWDNYPVNDIAGGGVGVDPRDPSQWGPSTRIFLGPYEGRAPDLADGIGGVASNSMVEALPNRIAWATMADYLADPAGYNPEVAWREAIADVAGHDPVTISALGALVENSRSSTLNASESPVFSAHRDAFTAAFDGGAFWLDEQRAFVTELRRERQAAGVLGSHLPGLAEEVAPFLGSLRVNARAAGDALAALVAQRPSLTAGARVVAPGVVRISGRAVAASPGSVAAALGRMELAHGESLARVSFVHGWRAGTDLNEAFVAQNRVDAFVTDALARAAAWMPRAALAAARLEVRVGGVVVPMDGAGRFSVTLPVSSMPVDVVATDGAGGQTGLHVALS